MSKVALESLTVSELKKMLQDKNLPSSGKKAELIDRLLAAQAEEEILETADSSAAADDNILNEENLLGESEAKTESLPTQPDSPAKNGDTAPEAKSAPTEEEKEKSLRRAVRLGLPIAAPAEAAVGGTAPATPGRTAIAAPVDPKVARAQRFNLPIPASSLVSEEAKAARAKRFSSDAAVVSTGPRPALSEEERNKLLKRAARFGIPVTAEGKSHVKEGVEMERLLARSKRFGVTAPEVDAELKKKARLERFGGAKVV